VNAQTTRGIVLKRIDYGEADRIITVLTPDHGKLRLMVRGVRKQGSKLAGGIELFSVSDLSFIEGKREIGTLISSRLQTHYGNIVKDLERVQLGYELLKRLDRATEDHPEPAYFDRLERTLSALDDGSVDPELIHLWFEAQLLQLAGHTPNLTTDASGQKLQPDQSYNFELDAMAFTSHSKGEYCAAHIKFLRLLFDHHTPQTLTKINNLTQLIKPIQPLVQAMTQQHH